MSLFSNRFLRPPVFGRWPGPRSLCRSFVLAVSFSPVNRRHHTVGDMGQARFVGSSLAVAEKRGLAEYFGCCNGRMRAACLPLVPEPEHVARMYSRKALKASAFCFRCVMDLSCFRVFFVLVAPGISVVAALQQPAEYVQSICAALEKSLDTQVRMLAAVLRSRRLRALFCECFPLGCRPHLTLTVTQTIVLFENLRTVRVIRL